jgi:hypothetical protein
MVAYTACFQQPRNGSGEPKLKLRRVRLIDHAKECVDDTRVGDDDRAQINENGSRALVEFVVEGVLEPACLSEPEGA